jgi:hypothetical protein
MVHWTVAPARSGRSLIALHYSERETGNGSYQQLCLDL